MKMNKWKKFFTKHPRNEPRYEPRNEPTKARHSTGEFEEMAKTRTHAPPPLPLPDYIRPLEFLVDAGGKPEANSLDERVLAGGGKKRTKRRHKVSKRGHKISRKRRHFKKRVSRKRRKM